MRTAGVHFKCLEYYIVKDISMRKEKVRLNRSISFAGKSKTSIGKTYIRVHNGLIIQGLRTLFTVFFSNIKMQGGE